MRSLEPSVAGLVIVLAVALLTGRVQAAAPGEVSRNARPAGASAIVAIPGSRAGTYATPVMAVEPGDDLTFVNMEPFVHSVRSVEYGPNDVRWCEPWERDKPQHRVRNPRQFRIGKCPLLWSLAISMTNGVVQTKVYGTRNLTSGSTVEFYCTVFPDMRGTLIVQ